MELAAGPPTHWIVVLADGGEAHVWADGVTGDDEDDEDDEVVFHLLMDIDLDRQGDFEVIARSVMPGRRVDIAIARFPRRSVRAFWSIL